MIAFISHKKYSRIGIEESFVKFISVQTYSQWTFLLAMTDQLTHGVGSSMGLFSSAYSCDQIETGTLLFTITARTASGFSCNVVTLVNSPSLSSNISLNYSTVMYWKLLSLMEQGPYVHMHGDITRVDIETSSLKIMNLMEYLFCFAYVDYFLLFQKHASCIIALFSWTQST